MELDERCPHWFVRGCRENFEYAKEEIPSQLPLRICWQYYQNLVQQEEDAIIFNKDAEALAYGLRRFPALERITITPAAHGWIFAPLYETPMIRAFPRGFNYPIPRGWPIHPHGDSTPEACAWKLETTKRRFRGFCIVTHALAQYAEHHVSELIVDVNFLETGINCRVFEDDNHEYCDFAALLRRPNFTRLDLTLLVGGQERRAWRCYRSGLLHAALRDAKNLQRISLYTNVECDPAGDGTPPWVSGGFRAQFVSLRTVFPVDV
ncbi:uncharacterized protein BJX67DRAFT_77469 [Aspergillus lucknowensis]|uniref:Uncharacterized protein n=1 Tax=Aspergillus lucknowensis TaxID=176173 RepID=A0ABR4LWR6_9EURO